MALFRGIQEYIALDANNITLVFDSGNIVNISGNIFLYPPQGHPILYKYTTQCTLHAHVCTYCNAKYHYVIKMNTTGIRGQGFEIRGLA